MYPRFCRETIVAIGCLVSYCFFNCTYSESYIRPEANRVEVTDLNFPNTEINGLLFKNGNSTFELFLIAKEPVKFTFKKIEVRLNDKLLSAKGGLFDRGAMIAVDKESDLNEELKGLADEGLKGMNSAIKVTIAGSVYKDKPIIQ